MKVKTKLCNKIRVGSFIRVLDNVETPIRQIISEVKDSGEFLNFFIENNIFSDYHNYFMSFIRDGKSSF